MTTFLVGWLRTRMRHSSTGTRLLRGVLWSVASAATRAIDLATLMLAARLLGREAYGGLSMAQSTIAMFEVFAVFGTGLTATKYVGELRSKDPNRAGRILSLALKVALLTAILLSIGVYGASSYLADHALRAPQLAPLLRAGAPLLFFTACNGALLGAMAGFEAFKRSAQLRLVTSLTGFVAALLGLHVAGPLGVLGGLTVAMAVSVGLHFHAVCMEARRAAMPLSLVRATREWGVLWHFSLPAVLAAAVSAPATWACNALLARTPDGIVQLGSYGAINQWFNILVQFPAIVSSVALPILADQAARRDRREIRHVLVLTTSLSFIGASVPAALVCALSPQVMAMYGPAYVESWPVLIVTSLTAIIVAAQVSIGQIVMSTGRLWLGFLMNLGWGLAHIGSAYVLVDQGAFGLACSRLIAYAFHTVWLLIFSLYLFSERRSAVTVDEPLEPVYKARPADAWVHS